MPTPWDGMKRWNGNRNPVTLVATVLTRKIAVQPSSGEQPQHDDDPREDPYQTQHYVHEGECRHSKDHDTRPFRAILMFRLCVGNYHTSGSIGKSRSEERRVGKEC